MVSKNSSQSKLASILFWSIVSAAFIGPGTVTTASKAGASYGFSLLWALLFSTIACCILQESAARITIQSGHSLGEAISKKFGGSKISLPVLFIFFAIMVGGIAYQAGNVLGAVSGLALLFNVDKGIVTTGISILCGFLLWTGNYKSISKILGAVVAIMGMAFCWIVINMEVDWSSVFYASTVPTIPNGGEWLVIGIIGTTIVPYNLFLGSGISYGQELKNMRFGLIGAIFIGGIISAAIVIVGTLITGEFSFEKLKFAVEAQLGTYGGLLLGVGLLTAGFTSAVTAPLAAAVTAKSLFGNKRTAWEADGKYYKLTWIVVLVSGLVFGISGVKPIPAIILAQVTNGLLLPVACIYLIVIINDQNIMQANVKTSLTSNILLATVLLITSFLGIFNIYKIIISTFALPQDAMPISFHLLLASVITVSVIYLTRKNK